MALLSVLVCVVAGIILAINVILANQPVLITLIIGIVVALALATYHCRVLDKNE